MNVLIFLSFENFVKKKKKKKKKKLLLIYQQNKILRRPHNRCISMSILKPIDLNKILKPQHQMKLAHIHTHT